MNLTEYGIRTEKSDLRIHISVCNQTAYVFPTQDGLQAIESYTFPKRDVFTGSIKTAIGYIVPIDCILNMQTVAIPNAVFESVNFQETDTTSQKGRKAVQVSIDLLKRGLVVLAMQVQDITDKDLQLEGLDIIVTARKRIQVKCDWRAGQTGNVFLQIAESNPYKMF